MKKYKLFFTLIFISFILFLSGCTVAVDENSSGEFPLATQKLEDGGNLKLSEIVKQVYTPITTESDENIPTQIVKGDEQMKGVWISFLEFDWALKGKTKEEFTNNINNIFTRTTELGLNTVIVQVRSHGDAYYNSTLFPTSKYVSGTYNAPLAFDPLEIMVDLAHKMNLQIHAWINPFRLTTDEALSSLGDNFKIKQWHQNPSYMQADDKGMWYLNPANDEVCTLISDGVREIVSNYAVDGIHIDDYFYVLPPEKFGYDAVTAQNATTKIVKSIYDTTKSVNPKIEFGISPAGGFGDAPRSDATQHTNIALWCSEVGYIDYIVPQIYWEFDHETAPFTQTMSKWENLLQTSHVKLHIGLASYKFSESEILEQQVNAVNASKISQGYVHFRYDNIK